MLFEHLPAFVHWLIPIFTLFSLIVAFVVVRLGKSFLGMLMMLATVRVVGPTSASAALDDLTQTRLDAELRCLFGGLRLAGAAVGDHHRRRRTATRPAIHAV
jgi:hypothetical protein